jgi:hypothetical protein
VTIVNRDEKAARVKAVFDSGSLFTIVRESSLPAGTRIDSYKAPRHFGAAATGSQITITGTVVLVVRIGAREIEDWAYVSPDLSQSLLIGMHTMQWWDISILHVGGKTGVSVGLDRRDPELNEVLSVG